jgi:glutamyl-tRNA reductase
MQSQPNHLALSAAEIGDAISNADVDQSVDDSVDDFWQSGEGYAAVPVIAQFREELNRVRERELAAALRRLPNLTAAQRAAVERLSWALMIEFMREPSVRLHAAAASDGGLGIVDVARYLFALDDYRAAEGNCQAGDACAA